MQIGAMEVRIAIRGAQSLKDRRRVVNSLKDRIKDRFNVAVAEVGDPELRQLAVLGVVTVSNSRRHLDQTLSHVVNFVRDAGIAELVDYDMEFL